MIASFERPFRCTQQCMCHLQEISAFMGDLQEGKAAAATVKQKCTICCPAFSVCDGRGADLYTIDGPMCVCDLPCCGECARPSAM